jgi:hypothetical protein
MSTHTDSFQAENSIFIYMNVYFNLQKNIFVNAMMKVVSKI